VQWIAPSAKDSATETLEKRLWDAADQMRANSGLSSQQYSGPVLGLIFLRFAEVRFAKRRAELQKQAAGGRRGSRVDDPSAYHAEGVLFLAPNARFDFLLALPEGDNIGSKVNDAMRRIERDNPQVAGVLPKTYELFSSTLMKQLLKRVSEISATLDYDAFGRIYEYDTIIVDTFRRMQLLKPTSEIVARFARQVDAMFEQVNTLQRQIQKLRQTRDLLLPRLLSGQVELKTT
jgi:type I restriction enzyme M protein